MMSDVQYKLVNGEQVPLDQDDLDQIAWDREHPNPPWQPPPDLGALANSRLDRGIEAGYEAVNQVGVEIGARMRQRREVSTQEIEEQLVALTEAVLTMIRAQRTAEPLQPPPVEPLAAPKRGARR